MDHTGETSFNCAYSLRTEDVNFILVSHGPTLHSVPKTLNSVSKGLTAGSVRWSHSSGSDKNMSLVLGLGSTSEGMTEKRKGTSQEVVPPFPCFRPLGTVPAQKPAQQPGNGSP